MHGYSDLQRNRLLNSVLLYYNPDCMKKIYLAVMFLLCLHILQAQEFEKYGTWIYQKSGELSTRVIKFHNKSVLPLSDVSFDSELPSGVTLKFTSPEKISIESGDTELISVEITNDLHPFMKAMELKLTVYARDNSGQELDDYYINLVIDPPYALWLIIILLAAGILAAVYIIIFRKFSK